LTFQLRNVPALSRVGADRADHLRTDVDAAIAGWNDALLLRVDDRNQVLFTGERVVLGPAAVFADTPPADAVFLGRIADGLKMDRRLVKLQPANPTAHYNLACSLALQVAKPLKRSPREVAQALVELAALGFDLLARGVVDADQQVADDGVGLVAQRRHRHDRREAAAVLADVSQLVNVLNSS
jgi:hypothetical protein